MSITLDTSQQNAVDAIGRWLHTDNQSFTMGGYAGTGKTTILRAVIEGMANVVCATPTGKAAAVLQSKLDGTGVEVGTLHSLIYKPHDVTEEMVAAAEKEVLALRAAGMDTTLAEKRVARLTKKLEDGSCEFSYHDNHKPGTAGVGIIVVDESSMVDGKVEGHLRDYALERRAKILFVGDPGQLDPPSGGEGFFERNRPDVVLENIHRQNADSAILRLAHAIRHGEKFDGWNDTDCVQGETDDLDALLDADQIITGKNITRRRLNRLIRKELGFSGKYPNQGERVICLRNEHGQGLINGVGGVAASDCAMNEYLELSMDLAYEDRHFTGLGIDRFDFELYSRSDLTRRSDDGAWKAGPDAQFDFGHAITVHKSQGSEWDHVLVWDDKMRRFDKEARKRWIYTAATRAVKKLTWVSAG